MTCCLKAHVKSTHTHTHTHTQSVMISGISKRRTKVVSQKKQTRKVHAWSVIQTIHFKCKLPYQNSSRFNMESTRRCAISSKQNYFFFMFTAPFWKNDGGGSDGGSQPSVIIGRGSDPASMDGPVSKQLPGALATIRYHREGVATPPRWTAPFPSNYLERASCFFDCVRLLEMELSNECRVLFCVGVILPPHKPFYESDTMYQDEEGN